MLILPSSATLWASWGICKLWGYCPLTPDNSAEDVLWHAGPAKGQATPPHNPSPAKGHSPGELQVNTQARQSVHSRVVTMTQCLLLTS